MYFILSLVKILYFFRVIRYQFLPEIFSYLMTEKYKIDVVIVVVVIVQYPVQKFERPVQNLKRSRVSYIILNTTLIQRVWWNITHNRLEKYTITRRVLHSSNVLLSRNVRGSLSRVSVGIQSGSPSWVSYLAKSLPFLTLV